MLFLSSKCKICLQRYFSRAECQSPPRYARSAVRAVFRMRYSVNSFAYAESFDARRPDCAFIAQIVGKVMLNSAGRTVGKNNGMRKHAGTLLSNAVFEPTVKIFLCSDSALFENGYRTSIMQTDIKKSVCISAFLSF